MSLAGMLVINHRARSVSSLKSGELGRMINYYARENARGRQIISDGNDRHATPDDLHLDLKYCAELGRLIDYGAREGSFANRNEERPMAPGEVSGGYFGQRGIVQTDEVRRILAETDSHIVSTVISVRREDAERLGLTTKLDFERLLRAKWIDSVEKWGLIERQDIGWFAAFHTDNARNIHVHVITYDSSGRYGRRNSPTIPKSNLRRASGVLREAALERELRSSRHERGYLRDFIVARTGQLLGNPVLPSTCERLEKAREACGSPVSVGSLRTDGPIGDSERRIGAISAVMPEGDGRVLSIARSSSAVVDAAMAEIVALRRDDAVLGRAVGRWRECIRQESEAIGIVGSETYRGRVVSCADARLLKAEYDLNHRCANVALHAVERARWVAGIERDERGRGDCGAEGRAGDASRVERSRAGSEGDARGGGRGSDCRADSPAPSSYEEARSFLSELSRAADAADVVAGLLSMTAPGHEESRSCGRNFSGSQRRSEGHPDESRTEHERAGRGR